MTPSISATVVVEFTPRGRGAVAVVIVDGPEAVRAVDRSFVARSGGAVCDIPIGRIALGRWGGADGEELVLCRRNEQQIEVHCHGGIAAVAAVMGRLVCQGCQRISWQTWIGRCAPDRLRASAQIALADAVTERTAAILLDQWNGALSAAILGIVGHIAAAEMEAAAETIDELLGRQKLGLHLIHPWRVVVFGPPNVGKSSLINAIAGYERVIVSPLAGTTRDVVTVTTAIDGWPVQLSDTAGLRETQDELESAGIALATNVLSRADLAIFVHDAAKLRDELMDANQLEQRALASCVPSVPMIQVVNKIDLIPTSERLQLLQSFVDSQPDSGQAHAVSALNGDGLADLIAAIGRALVPVSFPAGTAVPFTAEQVAALSAAKVAIDKRDVTTASGLLHALLTQASN